jgi:hypothetical protein
MATAYTSLLGLALPVTGELSGSWGDTVNDAITSLLDTAVAGTTSITADADITLTTTTGVANQSRQAIILWNPASGTTTRNITAPAQSKIYTVINASGGTQSIVFRGAGPTTGVTIVKGESAVVAWNGTDFIKVSNTSGAGSFTTLTTSSTVTLNGGTANGVAYLNGSKVLTTGSALTFDGTNFATTGTASATKLIPTGGTATGNGMYLPATNVLGWSTNGTKQMELDASGNLGLGVTPSAWAAGWKTMQIGARSFVAQGGISDFVAGYNWYQASGGVNTYIASTGANAYLMDGAHKWLTAPSGTAGNAISFTQAMTLDASGNLGIGTTSPATALDVNGVINVRTNGFQFGRITTNNNDSTNGGLTFQTLSSNVFAESMRIDFSGALILVGSTAQKATGTTWSNPSDQRLKDNIRDYTKGTAELMQVRVREWEYNGKGGTIEGTKGLGVVADEVMVVLPDTVENYEAKLNADDEEVTAIKKFDATEITWLLVKTVQELKAEFDAYKASHP